MIIKPRSLISLSGRPECQGLVYAACPGLDLPYEMFTGKKFSKNVSPNLAASSPYGYCMNDNASVGADVYIPHSLKMNSITDKFTFLAIVRPSSVAAASRRIFCSSYGAAWALPYMNIDIYRNATTCILQHNTGPTTYQSFTSSAGYFATNTWVKIALTRDGVNTNFWKDGGYIEQKTATSANPITWGNAGNDTVGNYLAAATDGGHWLGDIVAIYIWSRVLAHNEISLISAFPFILFDNGHISDVASFVPYPIPLAPVCISPTSSSDPQADPTPFSWTAPALATGYRLQVATDAGFTAIVHDDAALVTNSASVAGLAAEGAFFWRVRASNLAGASYWSSTETFTRASNLTLIYPGHGSTVANQPVQFAWVA